MSRITKEKREGIIRTIGWITNINSFSLYSKTKNNYFKNKKLELNFYLKKIKVAGATTSKKIKLDLKCKVCGDDSFGVNYGAGK